MGRLPFDEVSRRLRVSGRSYLGVREIPLDPTYETVFRPGVDAAARHARQLNLGRRRSDS